MSDVLADVLGDNSDYIIESEGRVRNQAINLKIIHKKQGVW